MSGHVLFDGVWKRFHRGLSHDSLRDVIPALVRRVRPDAAERKRELGDDDFWAVRDVSFEVTPGHALGIIGGNGAGKSTILKLLTKILVPTRGVAMTTGRTGALIEVSAGFHPDLTGRENIFLQGAIMGMPQQLIRERFDDIVEFSGIASFIDTPVKRYSSGMNARLGFSIAAHLEPEVLIIDEVLSVGDAEFRARAFDKIRTIVRADIPVVIVSHQLDQIVELCTECILLRQGQVAFRGEPGQAVNEYLHGSAEIAVDTEVAASAGVGFLEIRGTNPPVVRSGERVSFDAIGEVSVETPLPHVELEIIIVDMSTNSRRYLNRLRALNAHPTRRGRFTVAVTFQANFQPGLYRIETAAWDDAKLIYIGNGPSLSFQVVPGRSFFGSHQLSMTAEVSQDA